MCNEQLAVVTLAVILVNYTLFIVLCGAAPVN